MSDTNEEQLLSDLLQEIRREDADVDAAHLEPAVMSAWHAMRGPTTVRLKADTTYLKAGTTYGIYASIVGTAAAMLLVAAASMWFASRDEANVDVSANRHASRDVILPSDRTIKAVGMGHDEGGRHGPPKGGHYVRAEQNVKPPASVDKPTERSDAANAAMEFVPLMPIADHDLGGAFQIVHVQMPRAALGALAPPLQHPAEIVEADVLLGEDGVARAIRISTNGSSFPWRSR